jgi:predicted permease
LVSGVSPAEAQTELRGIRQQLASLYPPYKKNWGLDVLPLQEDLTGEIRTTLLMLLATAGFVLLIACANVSNLLLARGNTHARELAIRKALGASSGRIVRQLLVESLLLAGGGCLLGLILASFGITLLTRLLTGMVPQILHPELDLNVLAFSILIAAVCGILFGLMPAIRATTHPDLNHVMKESGRGAGGSQSGSKRRSQAVLIVSEFAFTLVLLVGAGLFVRSFVKLLDADPGFQPAGALAFDLSFSRAKYPKAEDQQRLLGDLQARISALPGVDAAGAATFLPLSSRDNGEGVRRQDRTDTESLNVGNVFVSGDYFSAMGIRLQRGRVIHEADNVPGAAPVLVIDTTVAGRLFASGEDPIGKQLRFLGKPWEVVGVVSPVRHGAMNADPRPRIYGARGMASYPTSSVVVRSALPPSALIDSVRKSIQGVDPDQPISNVRTLEEAVYQSLTTQRTSMILLGLFALLAISLACVGIYGVMSYAVGQRARELSIRAALGANSADIVQLVLHGGLKLSFLGIAAGLIAAYFLARLVEKLLFGIQTHDPLVFVGSVVLLATVAALSIYLPARRAAALDPILALRSE